MIYTLAEVYLIDFQYLPETLILLKAFWELMKFKMINDATQHECVIIIRMDWMKQKKYKKQTPNKPLHSLNLLSMVLWMLFKMLTQESFLETDDQTKLHHLLQLLISLLIGNFMMILTPSSPPPFLWGTFLSWLLWTGMCLFYLDLIAFIASSL